MQKPFKIIVKNLDGWWSAVCPQLCVSGFGKSEKAAIESVVRAMCSTLSAQASSLKEDTRNISRMADFEHVAA